MLAIMNVGKYTSPRINPAKNMEYRVIDSKQSSQDINGYCANGSTLIVYGKNTVMVTHDNGLSFSEYLLDKDIAFIRYSKIYNKYFAFFIDRTINTDVYYAISDDGDSWTTNVIENAEELKAKYPIWMYEYNNELRIGLCEEYNNPNGDFEVSLYYCIYDGDSFGSKTFINRVFYEGNEKINRYKLKTQFFNGFAYLFYEHTSSQISNRSIVANINNEYKTETRAVFGIHTNIDGYRFDCNSGYMYKSFDGINDVSYVIGGKSAIGFCQKANTIYLINSKGNVSIGESIDDAFAKLEETDGTVYNISGVKTMYVFDDKKHMVIVSDGDEVFYCEFFE